MKYAAENKSVSLTCILVSCAVSFQHINGQNHGTSKTFTWPVSPFDKISKLETLDNKFLHLHFKNDAALLETMVSGLYSPPLTKSPNSSFLKWALQGSHKNSVFPCLGYPACKGGLEGLCLTPETQPRCWTGAKLAESCAALPFSWAQSSAAISLLQLKISLGQEEQGSQRRCTWYSSV